jgi:hypothetical protein
MARTREPAQEARFPGRRAFGEQRVEHRFAFGVAGEHERLRERKARRAAGRRETHRVPQLLFGAHEVRRADHAAPQEQLAEREPRRGILRREPHRLLRARDRRHVSETALIEVRLHDPGLRIARLEHDRSCRRAHTARGAQRAQARLRVERVRLRFVDALFRRDRRGVRGIRFLRGERRRHEIVEHRVGLFVAAQFERASGLHPASRSGRGARGEEQEKEDRAGGTDHRPRIPRMDCPGSLGSTRRDRPRGSSDS